VGRSNKSRRDGTDFRAQSRPTIDIPKSTIYNSRMGDPTQQSPITEEQDSSRRIIFLTVAVVLIVAVVAALLLRTEPKAATGLPPAYAANLKLSDFKMSAAENFVGATVSYIDGTLTNAGNKTVTHAAVQVTFKDDMGQVAQKEDSVPLRALKTTGPYPDAVDLSVSPLAPGQSQPFRLTFESISAQWNHQYPDIQITDVTTK
jgi:hypothetical protein